MRGMEQNKQSFWYALYERSEPILDEYGNEIGLKPVYGRPIKSSGNISTARGSTETGQFGAIAVYAKTINPMPVDCPIDESSVLWLDNVPMIDEDGKTVTPYDYVVTRVARSINQKAYTIKRVEVAVGGGSV